MITDTQWLLRALVAELEQAGIADDVAAPNVTTYDAALDALREYPQRVIFCLAKVGGGGYGRMMLSAENVPQKQLAEQKKTNELLNKLLQKQNGSLAILG